MQLRTISFVSMIFWISLTVEHMREWKRVLLRIVCCSNIIECPFASQKLTTCGGEIQGFSVDFDVISQAGEDTKHLTKQYRDGALSATWSQADALYGAPITGVDWRKCFFGSNDRHSLSSPMFTERLSFEIESDIRPFIN
jgi:hypothetical protein